MKKLTYESTILCCFAGSAIQAIIVNYVPLLFLTFQSEFSLSLSKITLLITINFGVQLITDFFSAFFVDRIGYRAAAVLSHILAGLGLLSLTFLPLLMPDPFVGMLISVMIYAVGGGLLEVIVSPMVEACPTKHKETAMSLLHSFYSWGHAAVILVSTVFFAVFGISNWRILAVIWTAVPIVNAVFFLKVPIYPVTENGEKGIGSLKLVKMGKFWFFVLLMMCAGASEQAVAQWASAFAESGLGVSKALGDLLGPMMFAVCMALSRGGYGKFGKKLKMDRMLMLSAALCIVSYFVISLSPFPVLGLVGCGLCGLSVGLFWPGTCSMAASGIKGGGTALFAFLALAGDLGCMSGPTIAGFVSDAFNGDLKKGLFVCAAFPTIILVSYALLALRRTKAE